MDVGLKIITTYTVQGLMPYINVVKESVILKIKNCVDTKCTNNPYKTTKRTLQAYKNVRTGKDMPIHFKYSDCLNITFLAMLYGLGMPIMYPMAAVIIMNQRVAERIQVAYNYRQPPAMDNSLSDSVMSIMKYAPIMLLFNGYWLMDNRQFFDNVWHYKDKVTDNMWSDHKIVYRVCQSSPLFLMSMTCVILIVVQVVIPNELLLKWGFSMSQQDMEVDEDLPNFFTALMLSEAEKIVAENRQMMNEFGFELSESWLIEKLENTTWPEKSIQGTPWYAIMCNNAYVKDFSWLGPHVVDRGDYMKDLYNDPEKNHHQSDVVSVMMNLGSIPDAVASKITLDANFATNFMGMMDEYKMNYEKEHEIRWEYSNQKLLDRYIVFKRTRESFQREYNDKDADAKEGGQIELRHFKR